MPTYKHPVAKGLPPKKVGPRYRDTPGGAIQALRDMSTYNIRNADAVCTPDPCLQGVWKVAFGKSVCIVYMAGYKDPWGDIRQYDDFETLDVED